jgi:hypothetical protein
LGLISEPRRVDFDWVENAEKQAVSSSEHAVVKSISVAVGTGQDHTKQTVAQAFFGSMEIFARNLIALILATPLLMDTYAKCCFL